MKYQNILFGLFVALSLTGVLIAGSEKNIGSTLACLYETIKSALAIGMLLLVVLAAIVYAVGQVLGAETRARASVWATAMFTGAIIGALLYILLPYILFTLLPDLFTGPGVLKDAVTCSTAAVPAGPPIPGAG